MTSGGWAGSDRKSRLPADWARRVAQVKARSGGRCELMHEGKGGRIVRCWRRGRDVDHKVRGDDHRLENLQHLCGVHHGEKSAQEGVAARRAAAARRQGERHPGDRS